MTDYGVGKKPWSNWSFCWFQSVIICANIIRTECRNRKPIKKTIPNIYYTNKKNARYEQVVFVRSKISIFSLLYKKHKQADRQNEKGAVRS